MAAFGVVKAISGVIPSQGIPLQETPKQGEEILLPVVEPELAFLQVQPEGSPVQPMEFPETAFREGPEHLDPFPTAMGGSTGPLVHAEEALELEIH
jgi:hypothetical protein